MLMEFAMASRRKTRRRMRPVAPTPSFKSMQCIVCHDTLMTRLLIVHYNHPLAHPVCALLDRFGMAGLAKTSRQES